MYSPVESARILSGRAISLLTVYALDLACLEIQGQWRFGLATTWNPTCCWIPMMYSARRTSSTLPSLLLVLSACLGFFGLTATSRRMDLVVRAWAFSIPSGWEGSLAILSFLTSSISGGCAFWGSGLTKVESVKGRRCRLAFGCCVRLLSELTGRCLRRLRVAMAGPLWLFWFGENMATADDGAECDVCV